jgi:hypothetical protein
MDQDHADVVPAAAEGGVRSVAGPVHPNQTALGACLPRMLQRPPMSASVEPHRSVDVTNDRPVRADSPRWNTAEVGGRGSAAVAYEPGGVWTFAAQSPDVGFGGH